MTTDKRNQIELSPTSRGSSPTAKHQAMVAFELEVMAKKMDRFAWDRDRGTPVHDRMVGDWIDALQGFSLQEVQAACRWWIRENPRKMPNEGDIAKRINFLRPKPVAPSLQIPEHKEPRVTPEAAVEILRIAGFKPKKAGGNP